MSFNIVSSLLSILGIIKIRQILNAVNLSNRKVKVKNSALVLHGIAIVLNLLTIILWPFVHRWYTSKDFSLLDISMVATETVLQVSICFICWTLGSSNMLRKLHLDYSVSRDGIVIVRLSRSSSNMSIS